jgi:hypothetical protein
MRPLLTLAVFLVVGACNQAGDPLPPPPPVHVETLPSGKEIKAFEPGTAKFADDSLAYRFSYLTSLPLSLPIKPSELPAITAEADEVWAVIRPEVEKSGFNLALIESQTSLGVGYPSGGSTVTSAHGSSFTFKRGMDGTWSRVPPGVNPLAKN